MIPRFHCCVLLLTISVTFGASPKVPESDDTRFRSEQIPAGALIEKLKDVGRVGIRFHKPEAVAFVTDAAWITKLTALIQNAELRPAVTVFEIMTTPGVNFYVGEKKVLGIYLRNDTRMVFSSDTISGDYDVDKKVTEAFIAMCNDRRPKE